MRAISEEIIVRAIQKNASSEEMDILNSWMNEDKKNVAFFFQLEEIWESKNYISKADIDNGWEMITKQIESLPRKKKYYTYTQKISLPVWIRYIAAIFVGSLITTALWLNASNNKKQINTEVVVQNAIYNQFGVHHITLPDNSEVWLNDESEITYLENFDNNRKVELKGKAFFDIKNYNNSPFIVQIGSSEIEVLGTEFFVESSTNEKQTVTLISGSISLHYYDKEGSKSSASLLPGDQAVINNINTTIKLECINTNYYVAFKDGTYRFTDEPLDKIADILAKHFDLKIHIEPSIANKRFTGRVMQNQSIENVLISFSNSYPVKYKIEENNIYITK